MNLMHIYKTGLDLYCSLGYEHTFNNQNWPKKWAVAESNKNPATADPKGKS